MPLKVVIELQIHAVTCPGVFLQEKDDLFLSVSLLGQCKDTASLPAIFPLLYHEKMRFEKVFHKAVDPATVAQLLENHTASFELIQQTHSGEVLAVFEENTREFLFPEPKLTPPYPGVDREVLMKTVQGFPGIAPKIEFSTRTTIKEKPNDCQKKCLAVKSHTRRSLPNSPRKSGTSPPKTGSVKSSEKNFHSPTRSSKCRSPSPFSLRRARELNNDIQQRLGHLKLGNTEFKSDIDSRPPFIVRHVDKSKPFGEDSSPQLQSPKTKRHSILANKTQGPELRRDSDEENAYSFETDKLVSPLRSRALEDSRTSPTLRSSLFHERFQPEQVTWESIHNRVLNLLSTHRAKQCLSYDISKSEADRILERCMSSKKSPNNRSVEHSF
ncbi:spermatogenesis associated 6-like protein [Rhinophrynus dorsalis]